MAKKFEYHVAVHKDPAETVWFAPGDDVPEWALDKVGDHTYTEAEAEDDVRFRDPHLEENQDLFQTTTVLPPSVDAVEDGSSDEDVEIDLSKLKKAELVTLAEERGLDTSGTKEELIQRIVEDDTEEDDPEE